MFTNDELQSLIKRAGGNDAPLCRADEMTKFIHGSPVTSHPLNAPARKQSEREYVRKLVNDALRKAGMQLESPASEWEAHSPQVYNKPLPEPPVIETSAGVFQPERIDPVGSLAELIRQQLDSQIRTPAPRPMVPAKSASADDLRKAIFEQPFSQNRDYETDSALPGGWHRCSWCKGSVRDLHQSEHLAKCSARETFQKIESGEAGLAKHCRF